ncbi:MAG: hypothetical protein HC913_09695 [Microscillaceae bacterium]|nr:hypothetical protein [Microscillaceae bacterium]
MLPPQSAWAQSSPQAQLQEGDRAFAQKKYRQAQQIYQQVLEKNNLSSAQVLLRLAYINEVQEQYPETLYYLSLYYRQKPHPQVLKHLEALALQAKLKGYETNEWELALAYYYQYQERLIWGLSTLGALGFVILLYFRGRGFPVSSWLGWGLVLFLLAGFVLTIFSKQAPEVIIGQNQTYLMDAPTAAAQVVGILDKGHKLPIVGQEDVWYRLQWEDRAVFVHRANLKLIP